MLLVHPDLVPMLQHHIRAHASGDDADKRNRLIRSVETRLDNFFRNELDKLRSVLKPPLRRRSKDGDKVAAVILLDFYNGLNIIQEAEPELHDEEERGEFLLRYGHKVHLASMAKRAKSKKKGGKRKEGDGYIVWDDPDFYNEL